MWLLHLMQGFELTIKLNTRTMIFFYKTGPRIAKKSESILEPEPEPPDKLSQFWNRTRNRQIIGVSSKSGTGRNMDPLQQWCR